MKTVPFKNSKISVNRYTFTAKAKSLRPKMNEPSLLVSYSRTAEFKDPKNPGIQASHSQEL